MDWLQNKTTQFIALAGIVGTLAGFGYTGATSLEYVKLPENNCGNELKVTLSLVPSKDMEPALSLSK